MRQRALVLVGSALWLAAVLACMKVLYAYESAPGEAGHPPLEWPRQSRLVLERDRDTVLLFVHPKCPCTVASIEEMQRLLACLPARPKVYVLLTTPVGVAPGWEEGLLQRMVTGSVSLDPIVDRGEVETKRFRVFTSGQVVVYDSQGRLQFCGGVTPSRGHQGNSAGSSALDQYLRGNAQVGIQRAPCYGCPLDGPSEFCAPLSHPDS